MLLSALCLLSFSDVACGFSQNASMLYVFRGLAGVANGGIQALVMMILSDIVSLKKRAFYQGILGGIIGLANMVGPCLAAAFVHDSTWRAFFWLLSPLAAICGVGCYYTIPTLKDAPKMKFKEVSSKIDYWGIAAGSAAIVLILIPISGGGHYFAWNSPMIITMLTIGGACMLGFLYIEYKIALLPMMPCKFCSLKIHAHTADMYSVPFQESTSMHHVATKLLLWHCVLFTDLLPSAFLP